jgi:chorismate dehydratase
LRIGCVKYLNARPLIHGWPEPVDFDHPSTLCQRLASGALDVALVSSFEFLRNPIYRIVEGVSISSDGPVYSVGVAHREEISAIKEIELDPASETSANLLRCLLAELGLNPRLVGAAKSAIPNDARLLIGDQAIRFRQEHPDVRFWDLGEEWKRLVELPFVYALWLVRPEVTEAEGVADQLRVIRDKNLMDLDQLIATEKHFDRDFCARYYRDHLRFSFGEWEKEGLRKFQSLCAEYGLLPKRELELPVV